MWHHRSQPQHSPSAPSQELRDRKSQPPNTESQKRWKGPIRITTSNSNTSYQLRFILRSLNPPHTKRRGGTAQSSHTTRAISVKPGAEGWVPAALPRPGTSRAQQRGPQRWGGLTAVEQPRSAAPRLARLPLQALRLQPPAGRQAGSPRPPHFPPRPHRAQPALPPSAPRPLPLPGLTAPLSPSPTPHRAQARSKPSPTTLPGRRGQAPVLPAPPPAAYPHLPPRPSARLLTDSV